MSAYHIEAMGSGSRPGYMLNILLDELDRATMTTIIEQGSKLIAKRLLEDRQDLLWSMIDKDIITAAVVKVIEEKLNEKR